MGSRNRGSVQRVRPGSPCREGFQSSRCERPTEAGSIRPARLFYSGDDARAKAEVRKIIERTGYFPVDLGLLDVGAPLTSLPFGSLGSINFIKI
jgi:predicted dinucleotide-binding enzyme